MEPESQILDLDLSNIVSSDSEANISSKTVTLTKKSKKQSLNLVKIIRVGLKNIFTFSDYFLCSFIVKTYLSHYDTVLLASSTAYLTGYFTMFVFLPQISIVYNLVSFVA